MRMANVRRAGALATVRGCGPVDPAQGRYGDSAAFACLFALAALTGCGRIDGDGSSAAAPSRKAGLWEQVLTRDGKPGRMGVLTLCVDAATDHEMGIFGRHVGKGDCERSVTRDAEGVYHFASTCTLSNGTLVKSMGTASGDFASGYKVHSEVNISGAPIEPMNGMHAIDITGRYEGACPAAMKPGDVSLGSGLKVNMDRLPQIASAVTGGG
ncbi:MAG TPA: DUF3617 family protein [Caulobacteraceae bacterium]|nr:DUF3617 family protein [Caulobacteraceae bacterium]